MKKVSKAFVHMIENLNCPKSDKSEIASKLLYAAANSSKNENSRFDSNALKEFLRLNPDVKEPYNNVAFSSSISKKDYKELNNHCVAKFRYGSYINEELFDLVIRLLDLKSSDRVLHVNAPDEAFLLKASDYTKSGSIRATTLVIPDNSKASDLIALRLSLNNITPTIADDIETIKKFKPNKVLINPVYNNIDKDYQYSTKKKNFWEELIEIAKLIDNNSKVIALVPNTMLSNSLDKELKKWLLSNGYIEGLISLPLRYYSKSLTVETSLIVISTKNKEIKVVDIDSLLSVSEVKNVKLTELTTYIFESYQSNYQLVDNVKVIANSSNLLISNIITDTIYEGLNNLTELSTVAKVTKGSKKTRADYDEVLDQTEESKTCLLTANDIEDGIINYDNLTKIIYDSKFANSEAKKGNTILTNKSTTVKISVIDKDDLRIITTGSMIIISPKENILDGTYLKMFFESDRGQVILSKARRGQKTNTLYPEDIEKLKIPCIKYSKQIELKTKYNKKMNELVLKKAELKTIKEEIKKIINLEN